MQKVIHTDKAPAAIGPYVQAKTFGDLIFTSGQLGIDPVTGEMPATIEEQTKLSLANLDAILVAAGSGKANVLKTTIFLTTMADFAAVNAIYAEYFDGHNPARSCIAVKELPKAGLVEIECVAVKG